MPSALNAASQQNLDLTELVGTQLFKQVSMAQVAALLRYCPTISLKAGDRLIMPGQTVDKIHLLLQGRLHVFEAESTEKPIGQIQQGECVGLSSFVDRQPCHVSIVSDGYSRLLVLDQERLTALLNTPTPVSRNLLFLLMTYLRDKAARAATSATPVAVNPEAHNHIDAVTGLYNQGWLEETLDRLILRAATDRSTLSLVVVDLFDHAGLNAQYGQEMLDLSLRAIAKGLSDTVRPTDLIARHGSGRFVIMLPGADPENTSAVSARLEEVINGMEIVIPGVCVLPPMRIVLGDCRMNAFVSGRKLLEDAFAALERNRATILAAMHEPVPAPIADATLSVEESAIEPATLPPATDDQTSADLSTAMPNETELALPEDGLADTAAPPVSNETAHNDDTELKHSETGTDDSSPIAA